MFAAFFPVINPLEVDTIETPNPFNILGKLLESEYFLNPGLLIRWISLITG